MSTENPQQEAQQGAGEQECPNCVSPWKCNGPHIGEAPKHGYGDDDEPQQEAPGAVACAEDAGEFSSDTAALAFLRLTGNGNPNVERAVDRLRLSLTTPQSGDGVVVPREPTEDMIDAALTLYPNFPRVCMWDAIKRAIAAALLDGQQAGVCANRPNQDVEDALALLDSGLRGLSDVRNEDGWLRISPDGLRLSYAQNRNIFSSPETIPSGSFANCSCCGRPTNRVSKVGSHLQICNQCRLDASGYDADASDAAEARRTLASTTPPAPVDVRALRDALQIAVDSASGARVTLHLTRARQLLALLDGQQAGVGR